jgi:hypothetical protein
LKGRTKFPPAGDRTAPASAETAFRSMLQMMNGRGRLDVREPMRTTFKIGERTDFLELESGRFYDATLRRFFTRQGDLLIEDDKPGTDRERCEIMLATCKKDAVVYVQPPSPAQPQTATAGSATASE